MKHASNSDCDRIHQRNAGLKLSWQSIFALAVVLVATPVTSALAATSADSRLEWFRDARFGMFIHWGLYSVPAGQWGRKTTYNEWIQLQTGMSNAQLQAVRRPSSIRTQI